MELINISQFKGDSSNFSMIRNALLETVTEKDPNRRLLLYNRKYEEQSDQILINMVINWRKILLMYMIME